MEEANRYIISVGNYEGGLLGLQVKDPKNLKDITTEYAFTATEVRELTPSLKHCIGIN